MLYLTIDARSPAPLYVQIMDQVRGYVRDGTLKPGAPLPSVRQLALDLDINPNTVAKAYMLLEREGIIRTVRRRGTFIADSAQSNALKALDQRLDETLQRVLEETAGLGVGKRELLDALSRRLAEAESQNKLLGGETK